MRFNFRNTLEYSVLNSMCRSKDAEMEVNKTVFGRWSFVKNFMLLVSILCVRIQ